MSVTAVQSGFWNQLNRQFRTSDIDADSTGKGLSGYSCIPCCVGRFEVGPQVRMSFYFLRHRVGPLVSLILIYGAVFFLRAHSTPTLNELK
jgi:hypothetical protein